MDFDEQDEIRRKRMRFLEKGASSEDTGPRMAASDLIGDAIKARELEFALDNGSERRKKTTPPEAKVSHVATAENTEIHERLHPNQNEVVAAYASGEGQFLLQHAEKRCRVSLICSPALHDQQQLTMYQKPTATSPGPRRCRRLHCTQWERLHQLECPEASRNISSQ